MIFKELRYLLVMQREGSISKSAQVLYTSQPSLGQFLNNIERELGFEIFERTSQGIFPTERGKAYLKMIAGLAASYDQQMLQMQDKSNHADIRLGIGDQRGTVVLPFVICKANERMPNVRLQINDNFVEKSKLIEAYHLEKLDIICITTFSMAREPAHNNMEYHTLAEEELFLAVPGGNPILNRIHTAPHTGRIWLDVQELQNQSFILCSPQRGLGQVALHILEKKCIQPEILHYSTNMATVLAACASCNALSVVPQGYIRKDLPLHYVSLGEKGYFWTHLAICRKDEGATPFMEEMISILRESFVDSIQGKHLA